MSKEVLEIRINPEYSQLNRSIYDKSLKEDSIPQIRQKIVTTDLYMKKINNKMNTTTTFIPTNCRYLEKLSDGSHLVVTEEAPAIRTIKFDFPYEKELYQLEEAGKLKEWGISRDEYIKNKPSKPYSYRLAFPYVVFIQAFDRNNYLYAGQVFFRVARLSGFADYLLKAPLLNISSDQFICYGEFNEENRSLEAAVQDTSLTFWSTKFNDDYVYNYQCYRSKPIFGNYIEWEYYTELNPMFIYSADWIKIDKNIGQMIGKFKERYKLNGNRRFGFSDLSKLFTSPSTTSKVEKVTKNHTKELYYDVAQGLFLTRNLFINVGDSLTLKNGKRAYINSFISFLDASDIKYIQLKDENGKEILLKYNNRVAKFLKDVFEKERNQKEGMFANGKKVKAGDIVAIKPVNAIKKTNVPPIYKKVQYIRKTIDGMTEARLNDTFYILENTVGQVVDLNKPIYGDIKISKDKEYLLISSINKTCIHRGAAVKFNNVTVDSKGSLVLKFIDHSSIGNGYEHNLKSNSQYKRLVEIHNTRKLPDIFKVNRTLMTTYPRGLAWGSEHGLILHDKCEIQTPRINSFVKNCLLDNNTRLHVEGVDSDIDFQIGDKVVSADWLNPINTLIIKTIQGFKVNKDTGIIDFVLEDKNGKLTITEYIDITHGIIFVGRIRRIVNEYEKVLAGTKIIAEKGYIPNFPKKDTNIIIGFITDTGRDDPLVLCSNGCTLWYSFMMKNFKRVTMKSSKWKNLQHVPLDIRKIPFQPGDIIQYKGFDENRSGWVIYLNNHSTQKIVKAAYSRYISTHSLDSYIKDSSYFDCIPNPRIPRKDINLENCRNGYTNYHGHFIENSISKFRFIDEGSFLNV